MKWRREIDYHGSRTYGTDDPTAGQFRALLAWLAKIGGRKPRSPSSTAPVSGEHGFSLLGVTGSRTPKSADCPFPTKSADYYDRRDWRLLP
jgi:hypothetical protein